MKNKVEEKLKLIQQQYELELKKGPYGNMTEHANFLYGWILALKWLLDNWEE